MMMRRPTILLRRCMLMILIALCTAAPLVYAATPDEIDAAIKSGKDYLYSRQKRGNWEAKATAPTDADVKKTPGAASSIVAGQWGEYTALATYAMLASGDSPTDDKLVAPIKFLHDTKIWGTYSLAAKAQLYPYMPTSDEVKRNANDDLQKLLSAQLSQGSAKGLYDTLLDSTRYTHFDHSVSMYGVLGVLACEDAGVEVPNEFWKSTEAAWIRDQDSSGAFAYGQHPTSRYPLSTGMTAAGLAMLYITQDHLHADNGVLCKGNITNPNIEKGLAWLTDNFDKVLPDRTQRYAPYSTLFDVERVGIASGLKYFGTVSWYDVGADYLVKSQESNGSWGKDMANTAFSILFLTHGRAPVVFNKLQYNVGSAIGNWNQRPRDAANLTRYVSQQTERDLKWQIVNLAAPIAELHDAPILYLGGNQALQFSADEQAKLKQFCEEGGLIVGNADCQSADFAKSFRKLGATLFPNYEFRDLPEDHPIYTNEQYPRSQWKNPPTVLSLSNGVRELMMLFPDADPARYWQLDEVTGREEFYQSAANIFLYATDKQNLLTRGKSFLVYPNEDVKPDRRIKLARLQYDGNYDPEPGGWRRLAAILRNDAGIRLDVLPIKLGAAKLGNGHGIGAHVAHLTGTTRFKLDDAARADLKKFVEGGGTLILDAAGGSTEFADAAEAELTEAFGADAARQLKIPLFASNPIYNLPGGKISDFGFRAYSRKIAGTLRGPQIKVVTIKNRPAIFFSREDLSAGLVGEPVDGIVGYDPVTATAIMRNLVVVAGLGASAPVTSQPTTGS